MIYPSLPTPLRLYPERFPRRSVVPYPARSKANLAYSLELASSRIPFVEILFVCKATLARFPPFAAKITKFVLAKAPSRCESKDLRRQS